MTYTPGHFSLGICRVGPCSRGSEFAPVLKFPLPLLHKLQTRRGADNFSAQWLGARAVQNPLVSSIQTLVDALLATSVGAVPKRVAI